MTSDAYSYGRDLHYAPTFTYSTDDGIASWCDVVPVDATDGAMLFVNVSSDDVFQCHSDITDL